MGIFQQFPYTNFHDLNLDWFINRFNELEIEWKDMKDYFNNLDISQIVSDKIQEMYDDGELIQLLNQFLTWYVTPEMFGAVGDGITDDTAAFQEAVNSGKSVVCMSEQYLLTTIDINSNNIFIYGNNATLNFGHEHGFRFPNSAHDIDVIGCNFELEFTKDSSDLSNYSIGFYGVLNDEYGAQNIVIRECTFNGGVFGIAASSVKNLKVVDCKFGAFTYKPGDGAGGYGILLQSCIESEIDNCNFRMGEWGRHDIYVSVDQSKNNYLMSKDIKITNCTFNHHDLHLDGSNLYYSPITVPIVVRYSNNVIVDKCTAIECTGIVSANAEDGEINNLVITGCSGIKMVYNAGASETKYFINSFGTYGVSMLVSDCSIVDNTDVNYTSFISLVNTIININNCNLNNTRVIVNNNVIITANNILSAVTSAVFRFQGTDQVKGRITNIVDPYLTGAKYYVGGSVTFVENFFEYYTKIIEQEVTSNASGQVDSNAIISGGLYVQYNYQVVDAMYSSVNDRILLGTTYNNRLLIRVFNTSMAAVANETFNIRMHIRYQDRIN